MKRALLDDDIIRIGHQGVRAFDLLYYIVTRRGFFFVSSSSSRRPMIGCVLEVVLLLCLVGPAVQGEKGYLSCEGGTMSCDT